MYVYGIHYGNLLVQDHISIVCHAVGNNVLPLKKVNFPVVDTDVADVLCHGKVCGYKTMAHKNFPPFKICFMVTSFGQAVNHSDETLQEEVF